MTNQEINIIEKCREGDVKAQFLLYKHYSKAMYNIAIRFLNNKMDAEDVLQESFLTAFEKISSLNSVNAFGAWIKKIVINNSISSLRKKKIYFEDINDYSFDDSADDDTIPEPDPTVVHKAIKELPEGCRTVLILHALEGYKHREIAGMMNITESTCRTQYKRALGLLNKNLKDKIYVN